jgi:hypothetical protein
MRQVRSQPPPGVAGAMNSMAFSGYTAQTEPGEKARPKTDRPITKRTIFRYLIFNDLLLGLLGRSSIIRFFPEELKENIFYKGSIDREKIGVKEEIGLWKSDWKIRKRKCPNKK